MEKLVLETRDLSHHFGTQPILKEVSLQVPAGSIYGFLGPNGAGKTTTLRLVLGLLRKQKGEVYFFGEPLQRNRIAILRRIGSLIEQPSLYAHLSGLENLQIYQKIYQCRRERVDEVLHLVGLTTAAGKKAGRYSLGMKQRLAIGISLMSKPDLIILDEPTNGLDPGGIVETRELLQRLNREQGLTVVVSSHLLAEVEKLATHVGIIHLGKLLFQGTLPQLQSLKTNTAGWIVETSDATAAGAILQAHFNLQVTGTGALTLAITDQNDAAAANRLLVQQGLPVYQLYQQQNNLEALFMEMTHTEPGTVR
jgi:lantibiotic transport system ATP-binding protein